MLRIIAVYTIHARGRGTSYTAGRYIFRPTFRGLAIKVISQKQIKHRVVKHAYFYPKCTVLHRFVPIFSKVFFGGTPDLHNWERASPLPPTRRSSLHRSTCSEFPRLLIHAEHKDAAKRLKPAGSIPCRTALSTQHIRSSGVFVRWSDGLEFAA